MDQIWHLHITPQSRWHPSSRKRLYFYLQSYPAYSPPLDTHCGLLQTVIDVLLSVKVTLLSLTSATQLMILRLVQILISIILYGYIIICLFNHLLMGFWITSWFLGYYKWSHCEHFCTCLCMGILFLLSKYQEWDDWSHGQHMVNYLGNCQTNFWSHCAASRWTEMQKRAISRPCPHLPSL